MTQIRLWMITCCGGIVTGCSIPHGSLARPVELAPEAPQRIAVGGLVVLGAVGTNFKAEGDAAFTSVADDLVVVPAASYDYDFGPRNVFGLEVSLLSTLFSFDHDVAALIVNPRYEYGFNEYVSMTVDVNIGYLNDGDSGSVFFTPTMGVRGYVPTGFGGFVVSQQVGTSVFTLVAPGSLAYDVPIPLGETARLHLFPEVRWDPTFLLISDEAGGIVIFSGGFTVMLEF